jgi:hypothetical protein
VIFFGVFCLFVFFRFLFLLLLYFFFGIKLRHYITLQYCIRNIMYSQIVFVNFHVCRGSPGISI